MGGANGLGGGAGGNVRVKLELAPDARLYVSSVQPGADHSASVQPLLCESIMVSVQKAPGGSTCVAE